MCVCNKESNNMEKQLNTIGVGFFPFLTYTASAILRVLHSTARMLRNRAVGIPKKGVLCPVVSDFHSDHIANDLNTHYHSNLSWFLLILIPLVGCWQKMRKPWALKDSQQEASTSGSQHWLGQGQHWREEVVAPAEKGHCGSVHTQHQADDSIENLKNWLQPNLAPEGTTLFLRSDPRILTSPVCGRGTNFIMAWT